MKQKVIARRQRYWDLRAAGNFIGGGTGSGLLIAAGMAAFLGGHKPYAFLMAASFVGFGLSLVWLEIGKPWRALNVFFHPQTSWMTREGILAVPLLAGAMAAAGLGQGLFVFLVMLLAGSYLYCQARILTASRAIPAWANPRTAPLIVTSGLAEGFGLYVALFDTSAGSVALAVVAGVACEIAIETYRRGLIDARAPAESVTCFYNPTAQGMRVLRVGALALVASGLAGLPDGAMLGGFVMAVSGWHLKALLVTRAAFTRGAAIPRTPTRGRSAGRSVVSS